MRVACYARRSDVEALGVLDVAEVDQLVASGSRERNWARLSSRDGHLCTALKRMQQQQRTIIFDLKGRRCTYAQAHFKRAARIAGYFRRFRHRAPPLTSRRWFVDISEVKGLIPTPADKIRCIVIDNKWRLMQTDDPWGPLLKPTIPSGQEMTTVRSARVTGVCVRAGTTSLVVQVSGTRDSPYFE